MRKEAIAITESVWYVCMCMFTFAFYYYVRVIFQNAFILRLGLVLLSIMHITDVRTHIDT